MTGFNANGPTGAERTFAPINGVPQEIKSMTSAVTLRLNARAKRLPPRERWSPSRSAPGCSTERSTRASCRSSARSRSTIPRVRAEYRHGQIPGPSLEYAFSATADGQVIVTDMRPRTRLDGVGPAAEHRAGGVFRQQPAEHHRRHGEQRRAERHRAGRPDAGARRQRRA